jgi:DNA-binding GntR family transcriptional regulator
MRGRAVRVPVMSLRQFVDLTNVRVAVEGFAAAETARNCSPAQLAAIREANDAFEGECRRRHPDAGRAIAHHQAFHFAVYEASGSPTLFSIVRGLWLKAGPVLSLDLRAHPSRLAGGHGARFHASIISAIERKDSDGARTAIVSDIRATADVIIGQGGLIDAGSRPNEGGDTR